MLIVECIADVLIAGQRYLEVR